ncbi:EGF domain-containing protein, partial [Trichostrongylus colubriformis]
FKRCLAEDIMCGRLQCATQAERPVFGDPTIVTSAYTYVRVGTETHQCHVIKTTYVVGQKNEPDPGMVLDGAECGNDKICVDAKCKDRSEVAKTVSKCNDQCHYRGICNNVGNCHCENGFGGTACEIPGFGGSVNSNPSSTSRGITPSTMLLLLFAIFSIAMVIVCFFYWFKKKRNIPKEFWEYSRKTLKLHGVLVPVRKAPPPPGGRRHVRESLNAAWTNGGVTYSVNDRQPTFVPPAIPLMTVTSNARDHPRSPDELLTHVPLSAAQAPVMKPHFTRTPSTRPKEPPPMVPSRPRDSIVQELYREHGAEMGIKSARTDFASRDYKTLPPDDPGGTMKKETLRPVQPPPPKPPKHQKPPSNNEFINRPPLPAKPPEILNGTDKGIGVRELAAKFDAQRTAGS